MSTKSESDDTRAEIEAENSESPSRTLAPRLEFKSGGGGYIDADALLEDDDNGFGSTETALEFYDGLARDNVLLGKDRAAAVLDGYFGQYSFSSDLDEHVEAMMGDDYAGSGFFPAVKELDGTLLLQVETMEYDGRQHIDYNGSRVSEELISLVEEKAAAEDVDVHYIEDGDNAGKLLIRSSP